MSGGHAHAPSSEGSGSSIQLASNLISVGKDSLETGKKALKNSGKMARGVWENIAGRVGDILIKKPVSAALHLAGGPVAKIVDGTFSGVARALTLGKIKKLQPFAKTFQATDSIIASVVDSAVNLKLQKTSREWKGTRGYLKHVHGKLKSWKKTTKEAHKTKKTAKKEAKTAHAAEKKAAKPEKAHAAEEHGHTKEAHAPTAEKAHSHKEEAHPVKEPAHAHAEPAHAPEVKHEEHGHDEPKDAHTEAAHKDEPHEEVAHPSAEEHGHDEPKKDNHGHTAPAH